MVLRCMSELLNQAFIIFMLVLDFSSFCPLSVYICVCGSDKTSRRLSKDKHVCEVYLKLHFPAVSTRLTIRVGFLTRFFFFVLMDHKSGSTS